MSRGAASFQIFGEGLCQLKPLSAGLAIQGAEYNDRVSFYLMEELTHAAFGPTHGELKTKMKVHELTEHYLGITLPEDYKQESLQKAKQHDIENRTRSR